MALAAPLRVGLAGASTAAVLAIAINLGGPGKEVPLEPCREPPGFRGPARPFCHLFLTREALLLDGHPTSMREGVELAKHPLYVPTWLPAALADERPEVWMSDRQVGIRFRSGSESGLVLTYGLWPPGRDPAVSHANFRGQWGGGRQLSIAGWPGLAIPASAAGFGQPPVSVVNVTLDRTEVRLYGRVSIQNLVEVAESLERVPPGWAASVGIA
jgi:hypothetical protein